MYASIRFTNNEVIIIWENDEITTFSKFSTEGKTFTQQNKVKITGNELLGLSNAIMNAIMGFEYFQASSQNDTIYRTSAIVEIHDIKP